MNDFPTALVILLTLVSLRPFFEVRETVTKAAALTRAGYRPPAATGCLYVLLIPIALALWWWYALDTDQILLGVIPTVGATAAILALSVENAARKAAKR